MTPNDFRILALPLAALVLAAASGAQTLPIVNPGFEEVSRPLAVGEITNGVGGAGVAVGTRATFFHPPQFVDTVEVPGWRTYLPPTTNTVYAGVMHPPTNSMGQPFVTGHSGAHVATLHHVWMQQTLPVRVRPRTRYRLSFLAGIGLWQPGDGVYVALLAAPDLETPAFPGVPGVTTMVLSGQFAPFGSEGQMLPYEVEFTTPATLPPSLAGRYVAIAFVGSDGIPMMNYDDFRLEATRLVGTPPPRERRDGAPEAPESPVPEPTGASLDRASRSAVQRSR